MISIVVTSQGITGWTEGITYRTIESLSRQVFGFNMLIYIVAFLRWIVTFSAKPESILLDHFGFYQMFQLTWILKNTFIYCKWHYHVQISCGVVKHWKLTSYADRFHKYETCHQCVWILCVFWQLFRGGTDNHNQCTAIPIQVQNQPHLHQSCTFWTLSSL